MEDDAFWIALAHLPRWRTEKINRLIFEILDNQKMVAETAVDRCRLNAFPGNRLDHQIFVQDQLF